jgi:hypothetical protein
VSLVPFSCQYFVTWCSPVLFDVLLSMPLRKSTVATTDLSIYVVDVTPDGQVVTGGSGYEDSGVQNRIVRTLLEYQPRHVGKKLQIR